MKKLIIGIGNPGKEYQKTRHNIGFRVIDNLISKWNLQTQHSSFDAMIAKKRDDEDEIFLVKPLTYVNLTGNCAKGFLSYYKIPMQDFLVISDDLALPFGKIRIRYQGSSGGHKGLQSIIQHLKTQEFARIRVGIGNPSCNYPDYVLGKFTPDEEIELAIIIPKIAEAVETWIRFGIETTMNQFNS
ncbi:MAG: aminoacyl-tRNA hydrolase [Planctomycetes bacterium]|nr:aminoacyl-tRNA hydrolase [Planctomycetota bacterium]HNZ67159.1 aminoacyl-tRNA hydrolase [Planctomycetota bacterium]HON44578.1 aminoacyl-tRNA hydrolase [Planctomycetota bacterium]HPY74824.1 aminoacyl-tRNA hydrolase [Planctomycetota bacterium]HQB00464.1 aminoacyl-tRNA hydrolase [Planctomycetota bacterium]